MQISYNWLKQYHNLNISPDKVAELLTGCGLEVESMEQWESVKGGLKGVVTGHVLTCQRHPNSDHLSLTTVDIGAPEPLRIVCGASNIASGQKVAVATIGTTLAFGDKEITLQKTKIRGEVSEGMICAEDELGLGDSHSGIMVLPDETPVGIPAKEYFGIEEDIVFTIGLTPNRVDAASHIGVARDLVAVYNNSGKEKVDDTLHESLVFPGLQQFRIDNDERIIPVTVEDPGACPRYSGVTISGIKVGESPSWLKNRIEAIGLRPINNIVDITNYILMETGQPLHAFDCDKITGNEVIIRKYPEGTSFVTLDGVERKLTANDIMISSATEPMCIGGVFGGLHSGVSESTSSIFLESACFDPIHIRKTSRHHGLQTDASFRFERGSNIDITVDALKRAALLIKEIAGGKISSPVVDVYPNPVPHQQVMLSFGNMDRLIGKRLHRQVVKDILKELGIAIIEEYDPSTGFPEGAVLLDIPAYKVDVTREADVIEEILRVYGYNNIEIPVTIKSSPSYQVTPDPEHIQQVVADLLVSRGFYEMMNNSLTRAAYYEDNQDFPSIKQVRILNPISRDLDVMRQTLLYGCLESVIYNLNRRNSDLKLFEFGRVYALSDNPAESLPGYHEETHLAVVMTGQLIGENWNAPAMKISFFDLKGIIMTVLHRTGLTSGKLSYESFSNSLFSEGLTIFSGGTFLGHFGLLSDNQLKSFDIKQPVFYAEVNWTALLEGVSSKNISYRGIPKFPEVRRDLALLVDQTVTFGQMESLAYKTEPKLLRSVGLFDVYEGDKIDSGKKSYALNFILRDDEKTLTDKDIEKVMGRLVKAFSEQFNAQLR